MHYNLQLFNSLQVPEPLLGVLKYTLPLKWKNTTKTPLGTVGSQTVVIGEKFYFGGGGMYVKKVRQSGRGVVEGSSDSEKEEKVRGYCSVLEYSRTGEGPQWRTIAAQTVLFGMAAVDDQLIIAGGVDLNTDDLSDQVFVLDGDKKIWTQPFPAMPTARYWPSAIGYKRWLVVAGGALTPDGKELVDVVEVLDTSSKQWYKASPLPCPTPRQSLAIIQDNLYIVWINLDEDKTRAHHIFIPTLISNAISPGQATDNKSSPTEWQALPDPLTRLPALVPFHGHLLAVGAAGTPSSTIAMYLPHLQQWQKVAELPTPRRGCTCCFLPATKELMVIGGLKDVAAKDPIFTMEACELDTTPTTPSPSVASAAPQPRARNCPIQ